MLSRVRERGFTLVELLVGIALVAALMFIAVPNFGAWLQNTQIRAATDAFLGGLQLARAEAVRRNVTVQFQLMSTLDSSCALSTSGPNWVVSLNSAVGNCGAPPTADLPVPTAPGIVQTRSSNDGSRNAVILSTASTISFNGLGRPLPVGGAPATLQIDISNPAGGACAPSGPMRCMRVLVTTNGQVRSCDPRLVPPTNGAC